ncbi:MAG: helix-turn-helix domain-containing protein [Provencibacterium sp.]|jgi:two-component system response regulator YesN|nr:helix-turn-helix domain-containing protein [Provencibacterium sp.]
MTILLVDDEQDILEGILDGIDFTALGIQQVRTATSAREAKKILQQEEVDILLTDIEMPGESGLDLLNWLRERDSAIVTLFCTSFANFDYAKKAVEMHSFDYYLKPVAYEELQSHLAAAVGEVRKNRNASAYLQMGEYWLRSQKENKRAFWTDLLGSVVPLAELLHSAAENGLSYDGRERFTLCLLHVVDREMIALAKWKIYGFRNVAEDLFSGDVPPPEAMIPLKDGGWVLVLRSGYPKDAEGFAQPFGELVRQAEALFHVVVNGYFQEDLALDGLRAAYQRILQAAAQDILRSRSLTDAAAYSPPLCSYDPMLEAGWHDLLASGRTEELSAAASRALAQRAAAGGLSADYAKSMRADLQQMVFSELNRCGINAHILFHDERYEQLLEWSLDSLDRFRAYIDYLLCRAGEQMRFAAQADSVVGRVKSYVQDHLGEEVNRAAIAARFFLNPDYLARLFKKETGQTLGSYLQQQRIAEAKKLLCRPGLSVNEIAQRVGYDNYSYFSQFFREKTGMSPSQFRKRFGS